MMDGVARLRMRKLEGEQRIRGQPVPGPAERDARAREAAQRVPWIGLDEASHGNPTQADAPSSKGWRGEAGSKAPCASITRIDSSQASNSGARRRPSTLRR